MTNAEIVKFTDIMETQIIESSVMGSIARGDYRNDTPVMKGASLEIFGTEAITIGNYTGTMTHQVLAGSKQSVSIDNAKYFSVKIDRVKDFATAPENLKNKVAEEAGITLALQIDKVFTANVGVAKVTVEGTKADVGSVLEGVATELDLANVPEGNRGILLDPASARMLVSQQASSITGDNAGSILYEGYIGKYQGLEVFKSNQITSTTTVRHCLGFDMRAIVMPKNVDETRETTSPDFFGILVQGVLSFGMDFIETETGKSNRVVSADIDHV